MLALAISLPATSAAGLPRAGGQALGARATPPAGYIEFCARKPSECGLRVTALAPAAADATHAALQRALYRSYMWSVAFGLAGTPATPAAAPGPVNARADLPRPAVEDTRLPLEAPPQTGEALRIEETREAPQEVPLTPERYAELAIVNGLINASIRYAPDLATYGVADYWAEPLEDQDGPKRGDCEDYVLEKRRALIARGWPQAALSIAVARTRSGEDHAVLLVRTDRGELMLDSLSPYVSDWRRAPYIWIERQLPGEPMVWVSAGADRAALTRAPP